MLALPPGSTVQDGQLTLPAGAAPADLRRLAHQLQIAADEHDPTLLPEPTGPTPDVVIVRFDFDFVLHQRRAWDDGQITGGFMPGMADLLKKALALPHIAVVVQTIRPAKTLEWIVEWLAEHGIPAVVDDGTQCSRDMFYTRTDAVLVTRTLRVAGATVDRALVKQGPDAVRELIVGLKRPSENRKAVR
ncbi:hypothetical protein [Streptomyces yaizuensis]|uniref:Uncharacterized protein n=1 Tax=Streptomyces yaizuensis TaxID=2989713 RepID=A0ABQ5P641_9ACTN|nr:hypothetical protein [Streptomyces sp. YSPA8]GLF98072.1 hypothetical protein SYYSPA8_27265 [Streptomyces sp. YSPA8]